MEGIRIPSILEKQCTAQNEDWKEERLPLPDQQRRKYLPKKEPDFVV